MNYTRVSYNGLIADIKPEDLDEALKSLRAMTPAEKAGFMQSVTGALDKVLTAVQRKQPIDEKTKRDTANDIGLWFANEVIEGRSENYKFAVN